LVVVEVYCVSEALIGCGRSLLRIRSTDWL